jgi:SsrA-binding protein
MVLLAHARARFDYEIEKSLTAGLVLNGGEVKSLRGKHGSLTGSFVRVMGNEAWLVNAQISAYPFADNRDYDPRRSRKLLLKKKEILSLQSATQQLGRVIIPLRIEAVGPYLKLIIGIGRSRTKGDKRALIKKRELDRELSSYRRR